VSITGGAGMDLQVSFWIYIVGVRRALCRVSLDVNSTIRRLYILVLLSSSTDTGFGADCVT
jgi:hypothetical protein